MFWLIIILGYVLPIISFYIGIYIKMESKQTIKSYIDQNDLDDIEIWIWIPVLSIIAIIATLISWFTRFIGNIKKP